MSVSGSAGSVAVNSSAFAVSSSNAEPANDTLTMNTSAGADLVNASGLAATSLSHLTLNGGNDNDVLVGSSGADTLNGDAGAGDYCDGGTGVDMGATLRDGGQHPVDRVGPKIRGRLLPPPAGPSRLRPPTDPLEPGKRPSVPRQESPWSISPGFA